MQVTFQVNLTNPQALSSSLPYTPESGLTPAIIAAQASSWFPNQLLDIRDLKHGAQFTLYNQDAQYFLNNFTTGPYAFLTVVSNVP